MDPKTPILDSLFGSVHQSGSAVYLPARYNPWNLFRRFSDVHIHCVCQRSHRDENSESEKKSFLRVGNLWKPLV